ncbi:cytochrome c1 [Flocculibacter collagenilyticus]|uniref:cytochrome c1 n=1 Tax=Flocculibacter collagenilyticus TaxID=2744479 RepID=UPI0018F37EE0|nr:cytochrome c1 [Flocculibacter collagenilyticus]
MKKILIALTLLVPSLVSAAGGSNVPLESANIDLTDQASLQRGAKLFMNYCLGCHQMQYQRYERTFNDIGIPVELGKENLIFTGAKVGEHIKNGMPAEDAKKWFGAAPPDLTLESRLRTPDWIYTYLKSFYADPSRPFGVNNTVFPQVGMPHVLQELQGVRYKAKESRLVDGEVVEDEVFKVDGSGELSEEEYDQVARDLTNFLAYVGEPMQLERKSMGWKVLLYCLVFFILAVLLKKEFWKDVD